MEWFKMHTDWGEALRMITDEETGRAIKHIYDYVLSGERNECAGAEGIFLTMALPALKRDLEKYEISAAEEKKQNEIREKRREAGRKGGQAKACKRRSAADLLPDARNLPAPIKNIELQNTEVQNTEIQNPEDRTQKEEDRSSEGDTYFCSELVGEEGTTGEDPSLRSG